MTTPSRDLVSFSLFSFVKTLIFALAMVGVFSFGDMAQAASGAAPARTPNLFDSPTTQKEIKEYAQGIDEEYRYRQRIDEIAPTWARELMFMYKVSVKYPMGMLGRNPAIQGEDRSMRIQSELAWMALTGHGLLATFDFAHADQSLFGSTSRLAGGLMRSQKFWIEVRNQCLEIESLRKEKGLGPTDGGIKPCAEKLKREIEISQLVGSNATLFIGSGIVISLGKRVFQRYASKWLATRVAPLLPAFARTKWAAAGAMAAIIVIPAGFVVASLREEHETNQVFYENLETSIQESKDEASEASILFSERLETERQVLEFALWMRGRIPKGADDRASQEFIFSMKMMAPHWVKLKAKREEIEARRNELEKELGSIPGITAKLLALTEERKLGALKPEDAKLLRDAQYLASLRLLLKAMVSEPGSY